MSIVGTLIFAWILTLFELDEILIKAVNELFGKNYSTAVYWFGAFIIGAILSIIECFVK